VLSDRDYATLTLALDVMSAHTSRWQKAALKRRDDTALARLNVLGDDVIAVRRKLFEMQAARAPDHQLHHRIV